MFLAFLSIIYKLSRGSGTRDLSNLVIAAGKQSPRASETQHYYCAAQGGPAFCYPGKSIWAAPYSEGAGNSGSFGFCSVNE